MIIGIVAGLPESLIWFRGPLIKAFLELGHDVVCFGPEASDAVKSRLCEMGAQYETVPIARKGTSVYADLKYLFLLARAFRKNHISCFLGYTIKPVVYGTLAARLAGVRSCYSIITGLGVVYTQSSKKSTCLRVITDCLYGLSLPLNRTVFFQNPDDRRLFSDRGLLRRCRRSIVINGSGVDLEAFPRENVPRGVVQFTLIARLLVTKGIREYTAAAVNLVKRHSNVRFWLVGLDEEGHLDSVDESEIAPWHSTPNLSFIPWGGNVRSILEKTSVYVLPSYREGVPRSVLEAMAVGRPIVTSDAPGCRETVEPGKNGFLVPVGDVDGLMEAIERFLVDGSLISKMGDRSRQIAEEKFDVRLVNRTILTEMSLLPGDSHLEGRQ
jgi:glycosyltransferase involved in cell wall biosynthesis